MTPHRTYVRRGIESLSKRERYVLEAICRDKTSRRQHGCSKRATVSIYVAHPSDHYVLLSQRAFRGNYCQQHSIERVEYHVELEREAKE